MTSLRSGKDRHSDRLGLGDVMGTSHTEPGSRRSAPISELVRSLFADLAVMVRGEAELAKVELRTKATAVGASAAMLGAGVVIAIFAIGTLIAAAVLAVAIVLPGWAAALVVATLLLSVAAALGLAGRARFRAAGPLAPTQTIETVQEDIAWMRRETEQLRANE